MRSSGCWDSTGRGQKEAGRGAEEGRVLKPRLELENEAQGKQTNKQTLPQRTGVARGVEEEEADGCQAEGGGGEV